MEKNITGFGLLSSLVIFGLASLILILETQFLIPFLSHHTGFEPIIFWFIVAGLGMFLPLLVLAYFTIRSEGLIVDKNIWHDRLRFKKMTHADWMWCLRAIILIGIFSSIIIKLLDIFVAKVESHPPFMHFETLTPDRYWLLLLWLPYWILNIMGEEIFWRGTILPRQEKVFGKNTWIVHGIFWGIFHIAFGWQLLLTLIPILFIQSYVVQRRKNSWTGVVIHAGINGPSFLAISFGLI